MTLAERRAASRPYVARPRLVEALGAAVAGGGVTLVAGAPGSGKSMALAEWARGRSTPDLWITPSRDRTDGAAVARQLVGAIAAVAPDLAAELPPCDVDDPIARRHLVEVLTELGRRQPGAALVIEDLHRVDHDAARHLGELVDEVHDVVPVVVVSRSDPPWPLSSWRLSGALHQVRQRDLDFSGEEAVALLDLIAPGRISGDACDEVVDRCGGWAAALVMTALSLRDHRDPDAITPALASADRSIADYLFDEVLDGLDERSRRVLVASSVCEEVDGDLASALSGVADAGAVLEDLRRTLHLLKVVPERLGWVRCHDVLRDMLRQQLALEGRGEVERLHRVAADWFGHRGDTLARCTHLAAVEDWSAIVDTVRRVARQAFKEVASAGPASCLELIPPGERSPATLVLLADLSLTAGHHWKVEDLLIAARLHPAATTATDLTADRVTSAAVEWGRPPSEVIAAADRVIAVVDDPTSPEAERIVGSIDRQALRQTAVAMRGRAHDLLGDDQRAVADLASAHALDSPREVVTTGYALATRALVVARSGSPDAETLARRALALADELGLVDHPLVAAAHLALAVVHLEAGRLAACDDHLDRCRTACRRNNRWVTRTEELIWRAERLRRTGDRSGVKARFEDLAQLPQPPPAIESDIAALRARVLLDEDRVSDAADALAEAPVVTLAVSAARRRIEETTGRGMVEDLTAREVEVLRHLVGHLTSAEIAEALLVSVHTVKTHQRHIYQKLGVTSRRQAVDVAAALGLLPT